MVCAENEPLAGGPYVPKDAPDREEEPAVNYCHFEVRVPTAVSPTVL